MCYSVRLGLPILMLFDGDVLMVNKNTLCENFHTLLSAKTFADFKHHFTDNTQTNDVNKLRQVLMAHNTFVWGMKEFEYVIAKTPSAVVELKAACRKVYSSLTSSSHLNSLYIQFLIGLQAKKKRTSIFYI